MIQPPGCWRCELLLDGLELIRANAAHGANVVLGQLGGVDLDLEAANNANVVSQAPIFLFFFLGSYISSNLPPASLEIGRAHV